MPTQTTYYRAIVKATSGSPSATAETSIQIVPSGFPVNLGEIYELYISGSLFSVEVTATVSTVDQIVNLLLHHLQLEEYLQPIMLIQILFI